MRVLFVTSEFSGLAKAGGLGDVSAGLPLALQNRGLDVRVLMPAYPEVVEKLRHITWFGRLPAKAGIPACRLGEAQLADGLRLYLISAPSLYDRRGTPYCSPDGKDWPDNDIRFARLSLAAAEMAQGRGLEAQDWAPDVLHVNDWPGGLAPAYLRWAGSRLPTVMTIHNIAYQGNFNAGRLHKLGIPDRALNVNGVEFHGQISFLKSGIYYADHVTTVSPNYAREITTEKFGAGLHGLIRGLARQGRLSGIVNGIGDNWDPSNDPYLPRNFKADDLDGKQEIASAVRDGMCLAPSEGPLFGIVSRLVHQKGLDLVAEAADRIVDRGGQIVVLGLGDPDVEQMLSRVARRRRDHIGVMIGFNEPMAHRIMAGSDFCLVPSRFEPCGLTQMQAQRYGSLPIAHATGGLADTIDDGTTGFLFKESTRDGLMGACDRAFDTFDDESRFDTMRRAAMARRFAWSGAAAEYQDLYEGLVKKAGAAGTRPLGRPASRFAPVTPVRGQSAAA